MLKIQENELIHSYLFRSQSVNGISDYSNILTVKGGWKSNPTIISSDLNLYSSLEERIVFDKLVNIGVISTATKMFSYDLSFRNDIKYFFNVKDHFYWSMNRLQKTVRVSFCDICIKEHIKELGYGLIEESWFNSDSCQKHGKPLYYLHAENRSKTTQQLMLVLRGKLPKSAKQPAESYLSHYLKDHTFDYPIYAPCFFNAFSDFIIYVSQAKHAKKILGKNYSSRWEMRQRYLLNHVYEHLKKNEKRLFQKYWPKYHKEIEVACGVLDKSSLSMKLIKFSQASCRTCIYDECIANPGYYEYRHVN
ncbi:hypothetical protein [Thiomicrorhabdus sp. Kp2]|uniref:hypothetical protein n=1 Tax=Thiomicrorhabdus sp. Kp2 TaxID=1123518 RepID=UPI0004036228|nr:hypothetical protein [Thiomicrorhabdus sp. Kp2]